MDSNQQTSVSVPNGTIQTTGFALGNPPSNICPGCGRCNCCVRPSDVPYNPYGYPGITYPQIIYGTRAAQAQGGMVSINSAENIG